MCEPKSPQLPGFDKVCHQPIFYQMQTAVNTLHTYLNIYLYSLYIFGFQNLKYFVHDINIRLHTAS